MSEGSAESYLERFAGETVEKDLEFTLAPEKIKDRLRGFIDQNPCLWLVHLVQFCRQFGADAYLICNEEELQFGPIPSQWSIPENLAGVAAFGDSPLSKLARIKHELEFFSGHEVRFSLNQAHARFEFLFKTDYIGQAESAFFQPQSPNGFLTPGDLFVQGSKLSGAEWRSPWQTGENKANSTGIFDFETLELARSYTSGFPWQIHCRAQRCGELDPHLVFHFLVRRRGFASTPVFGYYDGHILKELTIDGPDRFTIWPVVRVFGIYWEPKDQRPAQIRPIIQGYLADPISLPDFPEGVYCYAEASQLETDLSLVKPVENTNYKIWLEEQRTWMKEQLRTYLPFAKRAREFRQCQGTGVFGDQPSLQHKKSLRSWRDFFPSREAKAMEKRVESLVHFLGTSGN